MARLHACLAAGLHVQYEGGLRVPQIIRWKGRIGAGSSDVPVTSIDLFPTIAEAARVSLPESLEIDGTSLMPLLEDRPSELARQSIYWHYPHYWQEETPYSVIRKGSLKLIRRYEGSHYELYDLDRDLSERRNLAKQMPDQVRVLDAELGTWLDETGAILPVLRAQ